MSGLIELPPWWQGRTCWECNFTFDENHSNRPAVILHVAYALLEDDGNDTFPECTPLCAHHAELAGVDHVVPQEWMDRLYRLYPEGRAK
jgi:hypothetical protein